MLVVVSPQMLHSNVYLTSWQPRRRVPGSADLRFITAQQLEQQGGTIAGENSVGIASVYMAFPFSRQVGGAKDTQKGPGVSYCKPETLVGGGPIIYGTHVDQGGPNYQSDLSDLSNQGHYIREPRTLASNGISALRINSTVFQRAGIRTLYAMQ